MKNYSLLLLLLLFCCLSFHTAAQVSADSILTILQQKSGPQKEKRFILSIRYYFSGRPKDNLPHARQQLNSLLARYTVPDAQAIGLFVETMYRMELREYERAERALVRAIGLTDQSEDHYLLYACFTQLAFVQDLKGNTTEAIASFREARNVAIRLNDVYLQVLVDINISDIYYRNTLYQQSLAYLDQAAGLMARQKLNEPNFTMTILVNKAENYFSMGRADSLARYSRLLMGLPPAPRLYTFQQRALYGLTLLHGQYGLALGLIGKLKKDPSYQFDAWDEQRLAYTLFAAGMADSARVIAGQLTSDPVQRNHPEVVLPLYEMLGRIALSRADSGLAAHQLDQALKQAKRQINRLVEVDTVAARLKLDEMQSSYVRREESFKRERLWLWFSIVSVTLVLLAGAVLYRNIRQKRYFEKLLFEAKRDELSYINSHEVRRHLSNILGIIDTISHSVDRHQGYLEAEQHLLQAAKDLDNSIRRIAGLNGAIIELTFQLSPKQ